MIFKMSDREEDDSDSSRRTKLNGLSNRDTEDAHDRNLEETLNAFLASSLLSPDADSLADISQVAGEYTSLNNTIDELNRYLDRWDERHEQLRAHIREAMRASEEENEYVEESDDIGAGQHRQHER
ncbi:unnamed protein product [Candidula unifasciata]|uniref:Uncharacterized protein n=1 Tax=Candidula unifasciata TaxID=100452 RepID=A0A8S3YZ76_9EUPU|nr:unnamed protein product [Candidula unifasciata]